jgi:hypothetical protein
MAKGAVVARILSEYSDKGTKTAIKDLQHTEKKFQEFGKKVAEVFVVAAAAAAAFAVKLGVDSVKAAMAQQQQMAVLANTIHNVTGANQAGIESVDAYIKKSALRYNFQENELIPSLQSLIVATKNVSQAESLQGLAMNISTNKGKDLGQVSLALAKAYLGNFNALKRMGVPLSEAVIKHKDFAAAVKELDASFKGSAAAAADTFAGKIGRIGIAFDMVKKTIGNALITALQPFLDKFLTALPQIEKWLDSNSKKIAGFFITGIKYGVAFFQTVFDIFNFVARNIKVFAELGAVIIAIWAGTTVATGVQSFIKMVEGVIKVFKLLRTVALGAAFAEAISTGGASAAAGLAAATAAFVGINLAINKFDKDATKAANGVKDLKFDFKGLSVTAADYLKGLTGVNTATATNSKLTKDQIATLALLKKMGIVPTDTSQYDAIEQEAALLNLKKQNNIEAAAQLQAIIDQTNAQQAANEALMRYSDILTALADNKISTEEISVLAQKWGISSTAVEEYIAKIYAANSTPANADSILALYEAWGLTKEQAQQYIDFARALADEKLSSSEIENLMAKWGLTKDQVIAYAKKVQDGTVFSTTFGDPGLLAADSWQKALSALNDYIAKLGTATLTPPPAASNKPIPTLVPTLPTTPGTNPYGYTSAYANSFALNGSYIDQSGNASGYNPDMAAAMARSYVTGSLASSSFLGGGSGTATQTPTGSGAAPVVHVTVQGSVVSQNDLVTAVRDGLLNGINSGKQTTFSQVSL